MEFAGQTKMKINEIVTEAPTSKTYTPAKIFAKQKRMATVLQKKWEQNKGLLQKQNPNLSVYDFIKQSLPAVYQYNPNFQKEMQASNEKSEKNIIAKALDSALKATNYWQRQIERSSGMSDLSPYNKPVAQQPTTAPVDTTVPRAVTQPNAVPQNNLSTSGTGTATIAPQQRPGNVTINTNTPKITKSKSTSKKIKAKMPKVGDIARYAGKKYKWTNNAWRDAKGNKLTGADAKAATDAFRKTK